MEKLAAAVGTVPETALEVEEEVLAAVTAEKEVLDLEVALAEAF